MLSWRTSKNGQLKNRSSIMFKITRNLFHWAWGQGVQRNHYKCSQEVGKHQWLPLRLARHARKAIIGKSVARLMMSSQNLRVSWKPVTTRLRMEESLPNYHEDHIATKGNNSLQHYNLVHKLFPMPWAMMIPAAKAAVDKKSEKLEKIPAWDLTKSQK